MIKLIHGDCLEKMAEIEDGMKMFACGIKNSRHIIRKCGKGKKTTEKEPAGRLATANTLVDPSSVVMI